MKYQYPLSVQIGEVERELAIRKAFYPTQVQAKRMKEKDARLQIEIMENVRDTLIKLREEQLK